MMRFFVPVKGRVFDDPSPILDAAFQSQGFGWSLDQITAEYTAPLIWASGKTMDIDAHADVTFGMMAGIAHAADIPVYLISREPTGTKVLAMLRAVMLN